MRAPRRSARSSSGRPYVAVGPLRRRLEEIVHESSCGTAKWSGLQVTDSATDTVELRALVSARNARPDWESALRGAGKAARISAEPKSTRHRRPREVGEMRLLAWNIRQGGGSRLPRIAAALEHHEAEFWYSPKIVAGRRPRVCWPRSMPSATATRRPSCRRPAAPAC